MEAKELRIGNYVNVFGVKVGTVKKLSINKIIVDCTPIPLTEEWLFNLGFKKHKILGSYYMGQFRFHTQRPYEKDPKWFNMCTEIYFCERAILVISGCKEVHQLQNLYFALTGKELELKRKL